MAHDTVKDTFISAFLMLTMTRTALKAVTMLDTIETWKKQAKLQGNKNFIDLRVNAASLIRSIDAFHLACRGTVQTSTFGTLMNVLNSEQVKLLNDLVCECADLNELGIEEVIKAVRELKTREHETQPSL